MEKLNPSKTEGSVFKLWGRILGLFFYIDASLTYFFMDEKSGKKLHKKIYLSKGKILK